MARARKVVVALLLATIPGCGLGAKHPGAGIAQEAELPDVQRAKDRPPVVLVVREGDPASAVAIAVTVPPRSDGDDAESAVALAGMVEARLASKGIAARVTPQGDGYRAVVLASNPTEAASVARAFREALTRRVDADDVAAAKKKLAALARRPLPDPAMARWARCTSALYALPARAGKSGGDLGEAVLEAWRASAHASNTVTMAVAGARASGKAVAKAVIDDGPWPSTSVAPRLTASSSTAFETDVYDASAEPNVVDARAYVTLDVASSSAAVATADALGDPQGPLATRLRALDVPFRLREITAAARPQGGCVGVVLESTKGPLAAAASSNDVAARVADAVALVRVEALVHLADRAQAVDGRRLARRAGDARDAAERAAWWGLPDVDPKAGRAGPLSLQGSVALGINRRRGPTDAPLEPTRETFAAAVARANASWEKPVVEGRARVEPGQGETWVLVASPCGTDGESDADAGVTSLFVLAAAAQADAATDVHVEPWIVPDGAGLVVHGPARSGESPAAHARRLADVAAEAFAAKPLAPSALAHAQGELTTRARARDGSTLSVLADALSPSRPSYVLPWGRDESVVRASDAVVQARAEALRAGPIRTAVLASRDMSEVDAAVRATDRWVERRPTEPRACRSLPKTSPSKPGTYAAPPRFGALPEALLAYPFPEADDGAARAANLVVAALEGSGGLLEASVAPMAGVARATDAKVLGVPYAPALVVRVTSDETTLDAAVMQARALIDRIHREGLPAASFERARARVVSFATTSQLDPRARLVGTWRGDASADGKARPVVTSDDVRTFLDRFLGERALIVVASRAPRPAANP